MKQYQPTNQPTTNKSVIEEKLTGTLKVWLLQLNIWE